MGVSFDVVGVNHHLKKEDQEKLAQLVPLHAVLERQPENPHDENAIKVMVVDDRLRQRYFVGYLRRQVAAVLAGGLDNGTRKVQQARLEKLDPERGMGEIFVVLKKAQRV
jgi:hypothetical protein